MSIGNYIFIGIIIILIASIVVAIFAYRNGKLRFVISTGFGTWIIFLFGYWTYAAVSGFSRYQFNRGNDHFMTCSKIVDSDGCTLLEFLVSPVHWITFVIITFPGLVVGMITGLIYVYSRSTKKNSA